MARYTARRITGRVVAAVAVLGLAAGFVAPVASADAGDAPLPLTHQRVDSLEQIVAGGADGSLNPGAYRNPPSPICTTPTASAANVNTDCEGLAPHNETTIAVDPTNRLHQIAAANDYQLSISPGGTVYETLLTRAHVTFDGGRTWTTYPIPAGSYTSTGDPAVAFDQAGTPYISTIGFLWSQNGFCCTNPDILVTSSGDGGRTWATPVRIASGTGTFSSPGVFNDKEYLTAWGNGNAIVTFTRFNDGKGGSYVSSPILASVTHDGGRSWTTPEMISGSAPFCIGSAGDDACDQDQFSTPVVAADGSIHVAFESLASATTGRDYYLVVTVDPASGRRVAGPSLVATLVDGVTDYPIDKGGRQTYHDSQFRTTSSGNLAADPTSPTHLAVVWSDMRNSVLPAPADPYTASTNSDVAVSQSFDGGATWSAPAVVRASGDQFMPWAVYDTFGRLRIGYFDRSYDPANHRYGYTLATETVRGSLRFVTSQLTTALSDPTMNDRWFAGTTVNPAFPHPTSFMGDYSGIAADPAGGVSALWTDMRATVCVLGRCGAGQDAEFAQSS